MITRAWLEGAFQTLNVRHFHGRLRAPGLTVVSIPGWRAYGGYVRAGWRRIEIYDDAIALGEHFVLETLLHEMIHHAVETLDGGHDSDHGRRFCARANSIASSLGVARVRPDSRAAEHWPHRVGAKSRRLAIAA